MSAWTRAKFGKLKLIPCNIIRIIWVSKGTLTYTHACVADQLFHVTRLDPNAVIYRWNEQ